MNFIIQSYLDKNIPSTEKLKVTVDLKLEGVTTFCDIGHAIEVEYDKNIMK